MIRFFKLLIMSFRKLYSPVLTNTLSWSAEDFKKAKRWAQSRPHPYYKDKSIWEVIYSPRHDSTEVLQEINKFIIIENKNQNK